MRYREMLLPIIGLVLPGGGDAAADFVEPVGDEGQMRAVNVPFARFLPLEHHKALPVGGHNRAIPDSLGQGRPFDQLQH